MNTTILFYLQTALHYMETAANGFSDLNPVEQEALVRMVQDMQWLLSAYTERLGNNYDKGGD